MERMARGYSPQVRVPVLAELACIPGLKGPRSRRVLVFLPEREWSGDFSLGPLLTSPGVSNPGSGFS